MAEFTDLPLEILPLIVQHIVKASHLAALCLVNRSFHAFAVPLLYERIVIFPWYKDAKTRVRSFTRIRKRMNDLAPEIRDFPKAFLISEKYQTLRENCIRGIQHTTHLRSCTWTRDGSLQNPILEALQGCPDLCELEINGHHEDNYDPSTLMTFRNLRKISIIMPSGPVLHLLPRWVEYTGHSLRNLTLICKTSALVNDSLLEELSPNLPCIEHLYLVGCPRVTHEGVWAAIRNNLQGILGLGIEGLSSSFDIVLFGQMCRKGGGLTNLKSITLTTHPDFITKTWMEGVMDLLSESPLEMFQIYATENNHSHSFDPHLCSRLITSHGHRLLRFSVHRLRITLDTLGIICTGCPELQQLFVHVSSSSLESLGPILAQARKLRTVHVNLAHRPPRIQDVALAVVSHCSPTIVQFGIDTRVWQVSREIVKQDDGIISTRPVLNMYENPEIPEQFLVVRA
ncbi:hypothetical protein EVG20_g2955 [Dentipellis fragilis]|uniref:Uncharacterized protein n=1 Tax=Dentipellis fragilis TaxID=205917 RepID=A0A4Y9Z4V0_9AGAM|nr:hypothetical protein EVG20_g2955 [Dentipellis fragilis]